MLLAGEQEIANMIALASESLNHALRLVRWHDRVLVALEKDHGLRQPVQTADRRALVVAGRRCAVRPRCRAPHSGPAPAASPRSQDVRPAALIKLELLSSNKSDEWCPNAFYTEGAGHE